MGFPRGRAQAQGVLAAPCYREQTVRVREGIVHELCTSVIFLWLLKSVGGPKNRHHLEVSRLCIGSLWSVDRYLPYLPLLAPHYEVKTMEAICSDLDSSCH